jgi:hypothetical protein
MVECGQHWAATSVQVAIATCGRCLAAQDLIAPDAPTLAGLGAVAEPGPQRLVEVTHAIASGPFRFTEHFNGST